MRQVSQQFLDDVQVRVIWELERRFGYTRARIARLPGRDGEPLWRRAGYSSEASFVVAVSIRCRRLNLR